MYLGVVGVGDWLGEGVAGAGEGLLGRLSISRAGDTQLSDLCLDIRNTITMCTITFLVHDICAIGIFFGHPFFTLCQQPEELSMAWVYN